LQGAGAISIGANAGASTQSANSIAIGTNAGQTSHGTGSIAIGTNSGSLNQGTGSIAIGIGAGQTNQASFSICLNASATGFSPATVGFFAKPIRTSVASTPFLLMYDNTTNEIGFSSSSTTSSKTFIIPHPIKKSSYLVHACLEGPESGIYYRGKSEILPTQNFIEISLPEYVSNIGHDFTVQITKISNNPNTISNNPNTISNSLNTISNTPLEVSEVINGKFKVYGSPTKFFWVVFGTREKIEVEPLKSKIKPKGFGPYRFI
jgi:hypothetical protein